MSESLACPMCGWECDGKFKEKRMKVHMIYAHDHRPIYEAPDKARASGIVETPEEPKSTESVPAAQQQEWSYESDSTTVPTTHRIKCGLETIAELFANPAFVIQRIITAHNTSLPNKAGSGDK